MVETLLFKNIICLLVNLILLFTKEEFSLTFQKTIVRTSSCQYKPGMKETLLFKSIILILINLIPLFV